MINHNAFQKCWLFLSFSIVTLLFLVGSREGFAEEMVMPALVQVIDVANNNVLNIRSHPSSTAKVIGSLKPGSQIEVNTWDKTRKWGQIIWGEKNGWIRRKYLTLDKSAPYDENGMPLKLRCNGTEPFWSVSVDRNSQASFSHYDAKIGGNKVDKDKIQWSSRSKNTSGQNYAFQFMHFTGLLERNQCDDAMADREYGWALQLIDTKSQQLYSGCCRR